HCCPQPEQAVTFTSRSTDADGDRIVKWEWDLNGDGVQRGLHGERLLRVPAQRLFPVSLKVTDERGTSSNIAQQTVSVVDPSALAATTPVAPPPAPSSPPGRSGPADRHDRPPEGPRRPPLSPDPGGCTVQHAHGVDRPRRHGQGPLQGQWLQDQGPSLRSKGKALRLTRFQRSYRAGAVIQVYVTKPGSVGRHVRITVRKGKAPCAATCA
ncbi:MAG: hypothetical protein WKF31_03160, partial [Thermoleophilaceae bacterium]